MSKFSMFLGLTISLLLVGCGEEKSGDVECETILKVAASSQGYFRSKRISREAWEDEADRLYGAGFDNWSNARNRNIFRVKTSGRWPNRTFRVTHEGEPCR